MLLFFLSGFAFAHTGRPVGGEDSLLLQILLGLGLLLSGWGMVHFSSLAFKLPRREFRPRGQRFLTFAVVSTLLFALLSWYAVQPQRPAAPLLIQERGRWEVHQVEGLHSESTLLLQAEKAQPLEIQSEQDMLFEIPELGVKARLPGGKAVRVSLPAAPTGTYSTSISGLVVQVLPPEMYHLLLEGNHQD
ncbi:hypothetical protein [Deinococcus cellulosilyticus]|uniref:hypothetical protein n=1 Tax=Deinococcus cellulosilyticus TaxID=401558 RepID=UPI0036D2BA18